MPGIETRSLCALFAVSFSPLLYWEKGGAPAVGFFWSIVMVNVGSCVVTFLPWDRCTGWCFCLSTVLCWLCCGAGGCAAMALLACPQQGSAGRDLLPGLCFWCCSVSAFCPAWLPEAAPQALARQAWLKAQDSESVVATAQGLSCDTPSMQIPAESPF